MSQSEQNALYGPVTEPGGMSIGMHVRRGDRHPYEYPVFKGLPAVRRYIDTAREIPSAHFRQLNQSRKSKSKTRTLSGQQKKWPEKRHQARSCVRRPDVYTTPEMSQALRAQRPYHLGF